MSNSVFNIKITASFVEELEIELRQKEKTVFERKDDYFDEMTHVVIQYTRGDVRIRSPSSIGHTIFKKFDLKKTKKIMRFVVNESNDPNPLS